jgi:hypothetical protein
MHVSHCACVRIGQRGSYAGLGPQRASAAVPATPLRGLLHLQQHSLHTGAAHLTSRSAVFKSFIHAYAPEFALRASPGALPTRAVHCRGSKTDGSSSSSKSTAGDTDNAETHSSSTHQDEQPSSSGSSGGSQHASNKSAAANDTGSDDDDQVLQKLLNFLEGPESQPDGGPGSEDEDEYEDESDDEGDSDDDEMTTMDTNFEVSCHLHLSAHKQRHQQRLEQQHRILAAPYLVKTSAKHHPSPHFRASLSGPHSLQRLQQTCRSWSMPLNNSSFAAYVAASDSLNAAVMYPCPLCHCPAVL